MKNLQKISLAIFAWVVCTMQVYAFPGPPDGSDDPLPPEAPIDNWAMLLLAFGLIVGGIAIRNLYKKSIA